jgi:hypothetical protein
MPTLQDLRSKTFGHSSSINQIVRDWCNSETKYAGYSIIHDSTTIFAGELNFYPPQYDRALKQVDFMHNSYLSNLIAVKELDNVYYCGRSSLIIDGEGLPIIPSSRFKGTIHCMHPLYSEDADFKRYRDGLDSTFIRTVDEPVVRVVNSDSIDNYGHWHLQTLPSIKFLKELGILGDVYLLLPSLKPWQWSSLRFWFGNSLNIVEIKKEVVMCKELIHISAADRYDEAKFNRNQFSLYTEMFSSPARPDGSYIYLTRLDSSRRRVSNELELIEVIRSLGFKSYTMGILNYKEQIDIMKDARVIVGPHSSSIVNHLFAGPASKVCELQCLAALPGMHASHMRNSAVLSGKSYYSHISSRSSKQKNDDSGSGWHWKIDPISVAKYMKEIS